MENIEVKRQKGKMRVNPEFLRRDYLKKQTQFSKGQNERKVNYNKGLWEYGHFRRQGKQSQFKANRRPLAGNTKH